MYFAFLVALAFGFVFEGTVALLVGQAGIWRPYSALISHPLFLLVLLEAAMAAAAVALALARRLGFGTKPVLLGAVAGAAPELVFPALALAGVLRRPLGVLAAAPFVVDALSLPGRGVAVLFGQLQAGRWAVGLTDPATASVAHCWSLVMAGNVLVYAAVGAHVAAILKRRGIRDEPHNNSLQRARFARR